MLAALRNLPVPGLLVLVVGGLWLYADAKRVIEDRDPVYSRRPVVGDDGAWAAADGRHEEGEGGAGRGDDQATTAGLPDDAGEP